MPKAKAKAKPTPKTPAKLPNAWQLVKNAFQTVQKNPKLLVIVAVILIPTTLLSTSGGSTTTDTSGFTTLASILMNLAFIWAIIELANSRPISVKDAYYKGTAAFVQFILLALLLVLMLLPMVVALAIIGLGILPASAQAPERVLFGLLAILLAAPTIYWLTRNVFALFIVCETPTGPIAAVRRSRQLVKNRFWPVLGRLAVIALLVTILGGISTILPLALHLTSKYAQAGLQLLTGIIGLPLLNLYLHRLYLAL